MRAAPAAKRESVGKKARRCLHRAYDMLGFAAFDLSTFVNCLLTGFHPTGRAFTPPCTCCKESGVYLPQGGKVKSARTIWLLGDFLGMASDENSSIEMYVLFRLVDYHPAQTFLFCLAAYPRITRAVRWRRRNQRFPNSNQTLIPGKISGNRAEKWFRILYF